MPDWEKEKQLKPWLTNSKDLDMEMRKLGLKKKERERERERILFETVMQLIIIHC